jgi:hypothetical protein
MKATLKYDLPEELTEFEMACNAEYMHLVLWELDQWLRSNTKYAPDGTHEEAYTAYELTRDRLHQLMNQYNISFE